MPVTSGHFIEIEETPRIRQRGDSEGKKNIVWRNVQQNQAQWGAAICCNRLNKTGCYRVVNMGYS